MVQEKKVRLAGVPLEVGDDELAAMTKGSKPETVRIDYSTITAIEYERTARRRWKARGLASRLFLISKGKKHWLAVF